MKLLFIGSVVAQCNLVRIAYQEMGGRNIIPANCCSTTGLTCDRQGRVIEIQWANQGLSGPISLALVNIPTLETLNLSENRLSGEIPSDLEFLSNLKSLDLRKNALSGAIPFELSLLSNLEELVLANNQLSGDIPFGLGNLSQLRFLFLSGNRLTGPVPEDFGNLLQLTILSLDNNNLSGSIPDNLGDTPLQRFDFSNNPLNGPISGEYANLLSCVALNTQVCRDAFGPSPGACRVPTCSGRPVPTGRPTSSAPSPTFTRPPRPTLTSSTLTSNTATRTDRPAITSSTQPSKPRPTPPSPSPTTAPNPGNGQCRLNISPRIPIPDLEGVTTSKALFRKLLGRITVAQEIQRGTIVTPTDSSTIALTYEASLTTFEARNIILNNLINQFDDDYLFPSSATIDCTDPRGNVKVTLSIAGQARFANKK